MCQYEENVAYYARIRYFENTYILCYAENYVLSYIRRGKEQKSNSHIPNLITLW